MVREKATAAADLPHQYDGAPDETCKTCKAGALDNRHVAWEVAAEESGHPWFERELGS